MRCLVQRDMRSNECFLIANSLPYVEFSHTPRIANVKGSTVAKKQVDNESENIKDDDNWQNAYWNRENIDGYKKLCADYEAGKVSVLDRHPKDLSLTLIRPGFLRSLKTGEGGIPPAGLSRSYGHNFHQISPKMASKDFWHHYPSRKTSKTIL